MNTITNLHHAVFSRLERADWLLPTLARFLFAAILLLYFWVSGLTKLGDGLFGIFAPSTGAFIQIFPKALEAASYDSDALSIFHHIVVISGTIAEFVLPALIILGLMTRLAALGMIGFLVVQSLTDLYGHGGIDDPAVLGAWFDRVPDSVIFDQRALWVLLLLILVVKGAGKLSIDGLFAQKPA